VTLGAELRRGFAQNLARHLKRASEWPETLCSRYSRLCLRRICLPLLQAQGETMESLENVLIL